MAHPFHHAISSAKQFGGAPEDYQAIHDFFDGSKAHFGDVRHRSMRHHKEGIHLAIRHFGDVVLNSDGAAVSVLAVGEQHMVEDLGWIPSFSDWAQHIEPLPWMSRSPYWRPKRSALPAPKTPAEASAQRFGGRPEDYEEVHAWLDAAEFGISTWWMRALRLHSEGIFHAETLFGTTLINSNGRAIPVRFLGELHVNGTLGRIPSIHEWLHQMKVQPWMVRVGVKLRDDSAQLSPSSNAKV